MNADLFLNALLTRNRPGLIYQYYTMAPRLSGQTPIFGVVFFVSKSLLGIEGQTKLEKFAILTRKSRSHVRMLIYRTRPIIKLHKHENYDEYKSSMIQVCMVILFPTNSVRPYQTGTVY